MGTKRDWRNYLAQEKRDREERARREADAREQANVATAGDMGLKDKFARAQLAQQNMTRAPKRGGVAISPRSFSAPVDGSAPEGRPASSFREATVPQTASVAGLWGAPRRVSQFQGEVTGLAKGSLLDRWGAGGLYSAPPRATPVAPGRPVFPTGAAGYAAEKPDPSQYMMGRPPDEAVPAVAPVDFEAERPDPSQYMTPDFASGPRIPAAPQDVSASPALPAYAGVSVSPTVDSLMRGYTIYGSWSPEDQLDATNALARIRERLGGWNG